MNRMKPYDVPHKGLRNALSQFQLMAGNTNYKEYPQVDKLYQLGQDVFKLLSVHAQDENEVTLAELEKRCPGCSEHDLDDHEKLEKMQEVLERFMDAIFSKVKEGKNANSEGVEFYLLLTEYYAQYLLHTAEEERVTQVELHKHFTDEELAELRTKIMKRNPPEMLLLWFKFVIPAQSADEQIGLLKGFKMMASSEFFNKGMDVIRNVISPEEFSALKASLE